MSPGTFLVIFFMVLVIISLGLLVGLRIYYEHMFQASKKHPNGQMYCEFWLTTGERPRIICDKAVNGWEITAPKGMILPRYFFDKGSIATVAYPEGFPSAMQVTTRMVSWHENDPNSINPKRTDPLLTAERMAEVKDDDTLMAGNLLDEKEKKREQAILAAMANMLNKNVVYILLALNCVAAGVAAGVSIAVLRSIAAVTGG